jgi:nucleoside-diphosphate kinase
MATHPKEERTFIMVKPDGVRRGLTGEVLRRIEQVGLKVVGLRMEVATHEKVDNHYPKDLAWINRLGEKTMSTYEKYGYDAQAELGTTDTAVIGGYVRGWLLDYMTKAPVVQMVIQGVHAVDMVRKLAGDTQPSKAEMGTIRGDFSVDSAASANRDKRAIYNIVHASETPEEAAHEIKYWFGSEQTYRYDRTDEMVG